MGNLDANEDDVTQEEKQFVAQCYSMKNISIYIYNENNK